MSQRLLALSRTLPFHSIGGMQAIAWDLLREFARAGHEVTVLTTRIPMRDGAFESEGIRVVPIAGTSPERYSSAWWRGTREWVAAGHAGRLDGVLSVSSAAAGLLPLRGRMRSVPFVFQAHGTSWGELVSKWRSGRPLQWAKSVRNLYWMFKDAAVYRGFDRIALCGDALQSQFDAWPVRLLAGRLPTITIRNGVDTKVFRPDAVARAEVRREYGWSEAHRVVVFAARLHPQKGGVEAVKAFARARQDLPLARMLIIGSGEDEHRIRAAANSLGVEKDTVFVGAVDRERMPALLAAGDAFVFPTLRDEGLPMNVLEALSVGLTTVCSASLRSVFDTALPIRYADARNAVSFAFEISGALLQANSSSGLLTDGYTLSHCACAYLDLFTSRRVG